MSKYSDPIVPAYIKNDLLRLMNRISANEHWYEQMWLGVPVWQMPDDMLRLQEIVVQVKTKMDR
jgi:cephalosporin hydroxylase